MSDSELDAPGQGADPTAPVSSVNASAFVPDGLEQLVLEDRDAADIIERMRETHTNETRQVFLLKLDTLIARLGEKWEKKRDLVFEHLLTSFERNYPEPNWCVQIRADAWLGLLPQLESASGARAMIEIWQELCAFFVGDMAGTEAPVFEVYVRDVNRLALKKLDPKSLAAPKGAIAALAAQAPPEASGNSPIRVRSNGFQTENQPEEVEKQSPTETVPAEGGAINSGAGSPQRPAMTMVSVNHAGRSVKIASAIEPQFEMRKMIMIGNRLESIVVDAVDNTVMDRRALASLDWSLRELIDIVNIDQGLKLLRMRTPEQRKMMIVIPASFSTFASARARQKITTEVSKAASEMGLKILFEVRGLDGVPPHRVLEIVTLIKPFAMTVVGSVGSDSRAIGGLAKCGLSGVCIEYDGAKRDEEALKLYLTNVANGAKAAAGACMVQGFDNYRQMAVARLAGVTHASIRTGAMMSAKAPASIADEVVGDDASSAA